jgi:hypothetical protein
VLGRHQQRTSLGGHGKTDPILFCRAAKIQRAKSEITTSWEWEREWDICRQTPWLKLESRRPHPIVAVLDHFDS